MAYKNKEKLKKFFIFFVIVIGLLFFFNFSHNTLAQIADINIQDYFFVHLPDFKVTNPKPVSMEEFGKSSDNVAKYSSNDDPHFEITADSLKDAESQTYALITGLSLLDLSKVKSLLNNTIGKVTAMALLGLTITDVDDILKSEKNYFVIPCSYNAFFLTKAAVSDDNAIFLAGMSPIEIKTINTSVESYNETVKNLNLSLGVDFKAETANSYIDPITKTNYSKYLTFKDKKYALISTDEKNNLIKDTKSASGACFAIKPKGESNTCTNMIASSCLVDPSNKIFFLYGISCSNINSLFANKNSKAVEPKDTKTQAALLDKVQVQIQVPFGNVKNGISLAEYINAIYEYLIGFALVLAGIMMALGGFQYITGKGDAKTTIKNAVLGLVLLASSYTILQVVNPNALELKTLEIAEIKRDPFNGQINTSDPPGSRAAISADCSSIPSPTAPLPSGVTPSSGSKYDFNRYKNIKGFNPMCVLSDKALSFDSSYDATKIEALLNSRNSILAKLKVGDKTIAEVIYNAAKANNISPQILLVKLHKEQSLIGPKALKELLNVSTLSAVTDTMISDLEKRLAVKNQDWKERVKTNMLNFATGGEWRTGETRLMTRNAKEIDELGGAGGKNFSEIEKYILKLATGVMEAYKIDGWEKMSLGERYIRGRVLAYNQKLGAFFGQAEYNENLTAIELFGRLDKQIYMTAYGLGRCGSTNIIVPYDYVGAMKNTESSSSLHAIQSICPGNRMTACLYSYTPHVSAQYSVIQVWKSLGFDASYIFPESECSSVPSAWLQIGK